jgi:hypothetical protein
MSKIACQVNEGETNWTGFLVDADAEAALKVLPEEAKKATFVPSFFHNIWVVVFCRLSSSERMSMIITSSKSVLSARKLMVNRFLFRRRVRSNLTATGLGVQ